MTALTYHYVTHQVAACPSRRETEAMASLSHKNWRLQFQYIEWARAAFGSDIIVTRADKDEPSRVLDREMSIHYSSRMVGVIVDPRTCLVSMRTGRWSDQTGFTVIMTAEDPAPGPVALYPSALMGWADWWTEQAMRLLDGSAKYRDLPPPPLALDISGTSGQRHRVRLEQPYRTTWPSPPPSGPNQRIDPLGDLH
ncbi:hypothetical protein [Streptomyces nigrescens]|uniref:Uncharacterized protein n=1 Tax=Streptomyces nigrescens TaxID=1920 RepID=A0ABY7J1D7_STRNI|nr:hypothetical protein [Streptomyces nigrescens]WAU04107.1 hypothetical protein STRNI_002341 [Streptomyces nigrescens]